MEEEEDEKHAEDVEEEEDEEYAEGDGMWRCTRGERANAPRPTEIGARHTRYVDQIQEIKEEYRTTFNDCVVELAEMSRRTLTCARMIDTLGAFTRRRLARLYETEGAQLARDLVGNQEYKVAPPGNEDFTTWSEHGLPADLVEYALDMPRVREVDGIIVAREAPGRKRRRVGAQQQQQEQQEQEEQQAQQAQQEQQEQQVQQGQQEQQQQQVCPDSPIWSPLVGPVAQEADEKEPVPDLEL